MNAPWVNFRHFLNILGLQPAYLLAGMLCFLIQPARADIWGYLDSAGVAHFAPERLDDRYEIYFRSNPTQDAVAALTASDETAKALAHKAAASKVQVFFDISPGYRVVKHHLRRAANAHSLDYELLQALIATESGFDALAVSPKGAVGLMQLMPDTATRFGVAVSGATPLEKRLTDPGVNINAGSRYLRYLINLFPGQLELALAAYNAGEGAVQRAGNKIPNFKETQNYVKTVMQLYALLKPSPILAGKRDTPTRVRMQFQGGALNRGNMISSGAPNTPTPNPPFPPKTETD
jgi:soluble lytic murein transglycosylase-like protein